MDFRGIVLEWFNNSSEPGNIICGVPHCSILGPLLFYITRKRYHVYFKCT